MHAHSISVRIGVPSIPPKESTAGIPTKVEKVIQGALDRGMRLSFRVVVDSRDRKMKPLRPMYSMQEPNTIQTMENALPILMTLSSRRNMQSS